ncbi:hypothetical protein RN001_011766, partial [Aquatica leii]
PILAITQYGLETYYDGTMVSVCFSKVETLLPSLFFILSISVFFFLPLAILLILYILIAKTLIDHPNVMAPCKNNALGSQSAIKYRKQVIVMLGTVVLAFFICLLPFRAFTLWIIVVPAESIMNIGFEAIFYEKHANVNVDLIIFNKSAMEVLNVIAVITDINKICRICLSEKVQADLCNLYENAFDVMIENLINVKPITLDGLPNYICKKCADKLNEAVDFKEQIRQSEERLKGMLINKHKIESNKVTNISKVEINLNRKTSSKRRKIKKEFNHMSSNHSSEDELYIADVSNKDLKNETVMEELKAQTENANDESKYTCKKCKKAFRSATGYRIHLIKHGNELNCEVCGKKFRLIKHLNAHTKIHKDYKPHVCKVCSKGFAAAGNLTKHMRVHGGEKRHLCTTCGRRFYEPGHLQVHMRTHTGEKPIICNVCGKRFSDPHGLVAHNKIHTGERKYECKTCGKRFAHSFVLTAHNRIHTGEKPYTCTICGASYATSSYLTIHKRTHTQEKPFSCESCPKAFVSRCALVAHTMTHTGEKRFECHVCGKRVARAADLNIHLRSHTGERPYVCNQCPKRYHTSSNLSAHKRTHLGIKNHVCTICEKAFGDARTLKGHIRIHTGEKPYVCQICFHRYSQSGQLAAHRKTHLGQSVNKQYTNIEIAEEKNLVVKESAVPSQIMPVLNVNSNEQLDGNYNDQFLEFKRDSGNYQRQIVSHINLKGTDAELGIEIQSQQLLLLNQSELIHLTSSADAEDVTKVAFVT